MFVDLMQGPLSKTEQRRDDRDNSTIELVLHLFRNLLCAEPVVKNSASLVNEDIRIHHQLIAVFQKELVFDIIVFLGEGIAHKKNERWNLLIMEILHFLVRNQDPSMTAKSATMVSGGASNRGNEENKKSGVFGLGAARKREKVSLRKWNWKLTCIEDKCNGFLPADLVTKDVHPSKTLSNARIFNLSPHCILPSRALLAGQVHLGR